MKQFEMLREANENRQAEWNTGTERVSLSFRGNELAGETGEACNVIKKIERERLKIKGSRATPAQLAQELADVIICADLIASEINIDLWAAIVDKFNERSTEHGFRTRLDLFKDDQ